MKLLLAQATVGTVSFIALSALLEAGAARWTWRLAASLGYQGILIAGFCFVVNLWLLGRYRPSALAWRWRSGSRRVDGPEAAASRTSPGPRRPPRPAAPSRGAARRTPGPLRAGDSV